MISNLTFRYPRARYPFRRLVADALGIDIEDDVDQLHELGPAYEHFERSTDQATVWHRRFYDYSTRPAWTVRYLEFIRNVVRPTYGEPIVFQRVPTFRVALPGNVAVGEPHRDRDYMHSETEQNWWVPVTDATGTSAVWCESRPGAGDYIPLECTYGQVLIFDAANLRHFNYDNRTGHTRVSFDFRVIPRRAYVPSVRSTLNSGLAFRLPEHPGELTYWSAA